MFKTFVVGLVGLYIIKAIAETQPPKTHTGQFQEKINAGANQINDMYENHDKALQNLKKNVYDSGSEASYRALDMYDDAYKKVVDAKKKLDANVDLENKRGGFKKFWAGSDSNTEELQNKYNEAKDVLNNLRLYLNEYVHASEPENIAERIQGVVGKAQNYASEKYDEFNEYRMKENIDYYEKQAANAKKEWDDTKSSWLKWRKGQAKDIQDRAEAKYNYFKEKNENAVDQLIEYLKQQGKETKDVLNDINQKAKKYADEAKKNIVDAGNEVKDKTNQHVHHAKNYAKDAKDRMENVGYDVKEGVQENVDYAKNKIQDDTEYAKNYAAGVKDRVAQAGYNAKDQIKDNVEYAKHYAGGVKDSAAQAGYDAKDQLKDNAEYAKHYVGDVKDRAAQAGYDAKGQLEDNAEYAKHYAAGVKDRIAQAGYDAKDQIKDNAEYAKNYAGGMKDRVAQAGYNAKDQIEDNAEYAKHYAGGMKDRAAQAGYDTKEKIVEDAEYMKGYVVGAKDKIVQEGHNVKEKINEDAQYAKDQAGNYVDDAKQWIDRTGSYLKDQYHNMWNTLGVFQAHSKEVAEDAVRYYDQQVAAAKKDYDETQASWLKWRREQSQEVQSKARAKWEIMKAKSDAAKAELRRWNDKNK
jgi:hypothetical protein